MIRLTILLTFLGTSAFGQTSSDYELYSEVIQDFIDEGIKNQVTTSEVLIMEKYSPIENEISSWKEFMNIDDQDTSLIRGEEVIAGVAMLEKQFFETPALTADHILLKTTVKTLTNKQFNRYFTALFGKRIDRGWKRFYRKHPGAHGIFEFSQVVYNGGYACFYVGRHSNSLSGSGNLVIAQETNGIWNVIKYFRIWVS
jgi:hypothetical protein